MKGFIKIRRGIEEHLADAKISYFDLGIYSTIHLQANYETGVWKGSAQKLVATGPRDVSLRQVQRALQRLEEGKYIRRDKRQGRRGNYVTLIDKYEPQFGALRGKRLNAWDTTSFSNIKYDTCADSDTEPSLTTEKSRTEASPIPEVPEVPDRRVPEKTQTLGQQNPLAAPDHFEEFWLAYPKKVAKVAAKKAWLRVAGANGHFAEIIMGVEAWKASGNWTDSQYIPNPASFLNQKRWEDEIPIPGGGNGPTTGQRKTEISKTSIGRVFSTAGDVVADIHPGLPSGDRRAGGGSLQGNPQGIHRRAN